MNTCSLLAVIVDIWSLLNLPYRCYFERMVVTTCYNEQMVVTSNAQLLQDAAMNTWLLLSTSVCSQLLY